MFNADSIIQNVILLVTVFVILGCLTVSAIWFFANGKRVWKIADLVWVVFGGCALVSALFATNALTKIGQTRELINEAKVELVILHSSANNFYNRRCDQKTPGVIHPYQSQLDNLCSTVRSIVTESAPSQPTFKILDTQSEVHSRPDNPEAMAWKLDAKKFVDIVSGSSELSTFGMGFGKIDPNGLQLLRNQGNVGGLISEYQAIQESFDSLLQKFQVLQTQWDDVLETRFWLALRVFALCLVAFSFPIRIGKSVFEIYNT